MNKQILASIFHLLPDSVCVSDPKRLFPDPELIFHVIPDPANNSGSDRIRILIRHTDQIDVGCLSTLPLCLEQARHGVLDVGPASRIHPRLFTHHVSASQLRAARVLR